MVDDELVTLWGSQQWHKTSTALNRLQRMPGMQAGTTAETFASIKNILKPYHKSFIFNSESEIDSKTKALQEALSKALPNEISAVLANIFIHALKYSQDKLAGEIFERMSKDNTIIIANQVELLSTALDNAPKWVGPHFHQHN